MGLQPLPNSLDMSKLFLDVTLEAVGLQTNKTTDLTGKDTFSVGMWRENIGFGITNINIETSTNLQPICEVEFRDVYGNSVFGSLKNQNLKGSDIDYSCLFDWPPPKFKMTFKGYLGKPVTWMLNLKKSSTQNNPTDGSYIIKATFVPNQWGFFSNIPFLYLHAVKKLKQDLYGSNQNKSDEQKKLEDDKVQTIFDLIKIGKRIEFKTKELTGKYDKLKQQLLKLRTGGIDGISSQLFNAGDTINGSAPPLGAIPGFSEMKIVLHSGFNVDKTKRDQQIKELQSNPTGKQIESNKMLALIGNPNIESDLFVLGKKTFNTVGGTLTDQSYVDALKVATLQGQKIIDDNIKIVNVEIQRQLFDTSEELLVNSTISEVFSQLGGDAAFILGSILDAGIKGYESNKTIRDSGDNNRKFIGRFFPLETDQTTKEEIPAKGAGIDREGAEMDFVKKFVLAVSEGIAANRRDESATDTEISGNKLIERINNLEIISDNPYAVADADVIMKNILVRSGIAAFITRSNDPNKPGDYGPGKTSSVLGGDTAFTDRDSVEEIIELADKELKNITSDILNGLEATKLIELKRFCTFFSTLFSSDGKNIQKLNPFTDKESASASTLNYVIDTSVSMDGSGDSNIETISTILNKNIPLNSTNPSDETNVGQFISGNSAFKSLLYTPGSSIPSLTNSINSLTFESNFLFHNELLWTIPNDTSNKYTYVMFDNSSDVLLLDNVANNSSDSEFSSDDDKDTDKPLGVVKIANANVNINPGENSKRVTIINDRIESNNVLNYSQINNKGNGRFNGSVPDANASILTDFLEKDKITKSNIGNGKAYMIYTHSDWLNVEGKTKLVWGLFNGGNRGINQRAFLVRICQTLLETLNQIEEQNNNAVSQVLGKAVDNENAIYRQMHHIFHQWQILSMGFDGKSQKSTPLASTLQNEYNKEIRVDSKNKLVIVGQDGKVITSNIVGDFKETVTAGFRYDYPIERITPPPSGQETIVGHSIINMEPLYSPNANTTILNIIQQICTKNNFLFIPIPGYSDYTNISEIFEPDTSPGIPQVGNIFHILFTPTPESRTKFNDDTPVWSQGILKDSSLDAFEILFGSPNNAVIKSIQASTEDNKPTAESILNLQRLVDKDSTNKAVTADCSLLSVMEGRSYKMSIEMIGNAQVSPMQFFVVNNSPIFGGLYQVMKVHHSITPNNMNTTVEGMKMRFDNLRQIASGIKPVTLESLKALGDPANVAQPMIGNTENTLTSIGSISESIYGHKGLLSSTFIQKIKDVRLSNANDIDNFTQKITGQYFVHWFNSNMAKKSPFAGKSINSQSNFELFWNNSIPVLWDRNTDGKINFIEFLALNTIIIEETGGSFIAKIPEKMNPVTKQTSPGIAYAFDRISGTKKSYNTLADVSNKTALELFSDFHFKDAHGNLPFGNKASGLRDTTNNKWSGDKFPVDIFRTNLIKAVDPNSSTFINEADFFKFRGRGYIQVTGRSIYKSLIQFVLNYNGSDIKIKQYKSLWTSSPFLKNLETIATRTTNAQWDDLFSNTELIIAIRSIREHAEGAGRYQYIHDLNADSGKVLDKILNVARRISGSARDYVELYKNRILVQTDALDKSGKL